MKKPKLTRWFQPHEKPILIGVYEVKNIFGEVKGTFAHFNGIDWAGYNSSISGALDNRNIQESRNGILRPYQDKIWRGLAEDPNAK